MEKRIKKNIFLVFGCVLAMSGCKKNTFVPQQLEPEVEYDDVYLLMGQSNASGVSPYSFLESSEPALFQKYSVGNNKVKISFDEVSQIENNFVDTKFGQGHSAEFFGPEIGMAEVFSNVYDTCYIVKASLSGSCLQTQYVDKNGNKYEYYNRFISFIKNQVEILENLGKKPRIRGVFWMQGESDSVNDLWFSYEQAEQHFYDHLLQDLSKWIYDHFNFVDAYISTKSPHWPNPRELNAQKQNFCNSNDHCYCIKTNGEDASAISLDLKSETGEGEDYAHYDSRSMVLLGKTAGNYLMK